MKPYLLLSFLLVATIAAAEPIQPSPIEIVDGDTIIVRGDSRHVRLLGFDTPETGFEARCERERTLAAKATQRLRQLNSPMPVLAAARHVRVQPWPLLRC
jgi:endonuclease YncB( thermonuclease family)